MIFVKTLTLILTLAFDLCQTSNIGHKNDPFRYSIGSNKRYEPYNYNSLSEKVRESLSPNCGNYSESGYLGNNITLEIIKPSKILIDYMQKLTLSSLIIDKEICLENSKYFKKIGCTKGVALHPDSPRCHREKTKKICDDLSKENPVILNETISSRMVDQKSLINTSPFLIKANYGIVSRCGGVILNCGVLQTRTGCGAIRDDDAKMIFDDCSNGNCRDLKRFKKVFVLSFKYDSAIGHFMTEILPRIVYHIDLLNDPNVYIHYGCDKKFKRFSPPMQFLEWLGLNGSKFIQNEVFSNEVIVPRDGACQDALWNKWEIVNLRIFCLKKVKLDERIEWNAIRTHLWRGVKPIMVVIQRSASKFSANKGDVTRIWSDELFESLIVSLGKFFPEIHVVPFSDKNTTMMKCISCQIELFSKTTILIGMHGAGLSNMLFMPQNSTVIEITAHNDGRMLPGSGPFSRLAMASGINHYIHYIKSLIGFSRKKGINFNIQPLLVNIKKKLNKIYYIS